MFEWWKIIYINIINESIHNLTLDNIIPPTPIVHHFVFFTPKVHHSWQWSSTALIINHYYEHKHVYVYHQVFHPRLIHWLLHSWYHHKILKLWNKYPASRFVAHHHVLNYTRRCICTRKEQSRVSFVVLQLTISKIH